MSRTLRKKNGWDVPTYSYEITDDGIWIKHYYAKNSDEYKRKKSKYHRDGSIYGGSVPHEWINLNRERPLRQQSKQVLNKWVKNPNSEPLIPLYRRDAGYYYW